MTPYIRKLLLSAFAPSAAPKAIASHGLTWSPLRNDSRDTSTEILSAILWLAGGDERAAERVWKDPYGVEALYIWERVTKNGLIPSTEFCWGRYGGTRWARAFGLEG